MAHSGLAFCAVLPTDLSTCGIAVRQSICPDSRLFSQGVISEWATTHPKS
jgi:hypothetical protein